MFKVVCPFGFEKYCLSWNEASFQQNHHGELGGPHKKVALFAVEDEING